MRNPVGHCQTFSQKLQFDHRYHINQKKKLSNLLLTNLQIWKGSETNLYVNLVSFYNEETLIT